MSMEHKSFMENSLLLGFREQQWRLVPKYMKIFYKIPKKYQTAIWVDKLLSIFNPILHKFVVYLPFASAEQPFFRDGLIVSDFSGAGMLYAGVIEKLSVGFFANSDYALELEHYLTTGDHLNLLSEGYSLNEIQEMTKMLKEFSVDHLTAKYSQLTSRWKCGNNQWGDFIYNRTLKSQIRGILKDQRRYQIVSLMMHEYLNKTENWKHRKARLEGLEEYNAEQIFYMSRINRRCEKIVAEKYYHAMKFGPLLDAIRANEVLSNVHHFSDVYKCKVGSHMNPTEDKILFWDKDLNISNFNYSESQIPYFDID